MASSAANSSPVAPSPTAPPATASVPERIHDAAQQANNLRMVLQDDKQRIGCFLGAGCPLGVYDATGTKSIGLIPAVIELTIRVAKGLSDIDSANPGSQLRTNWDRLANECTSATSKKPTVEDILTELRALSNRKGSAEVLGMTKTELESLDDTICKLIANEMKKPLPSYRCSYNRFASWVGGIHRVSPVEIFTPNYDLLLEQALEQHPLPHFDGFVGSREPWFDLASIEHDVIPSRWTLLWKLHGSINWEKVEDTVDGNGIARVVRVTREAASGKVMIYPSHLKYDQSRRMPYLAMLDRLKGFFHRDIHRRRGGAVSEEDAPRLVICGYSFGDDHLNEILLDGLRGNRNAQCFALMFSEISEYPALIKYAEKQGNLTVLARNGAVIGTRLGLYRPGSHDGGAHTPWLDEEVVTVSGTSVNEPRCRLGDFHYFGLFLEQLCGVRNVHGVPSV